MKRNRPKAKIVKVKGSQTYMVLIDANPVYESDYDDCKSWVEAYNKGAF